MIKGMEVNAVTNTGQSAPVTQLAQGTQILMIEELADKINHLGNCYGCNKPGHVLRDCAEKNSNPNPVRNNYNKGPRRDSSKITIIVIRKDISIVGDLGRISDGMNLRIMKRLGK